MTLPPKLQQELEDLIRESCEIQVIEDADFVNLIFKRFMLGEGFFPQQSDLLLRIPRSYPDAGPDMFWVSPDVKLQSGQLPQAAESIETYMGKPWRRFSWHRQGSPWNPTIDNMHSQLEFIRRRLSEKK
jgi:hypothetical protein